MRTGRWLVSWVGGTDHDAAEGRLGQDIGPIAAATLAVLALGLNLAGNLITESLSSTHYGAYHPH